MEPVVKKLPTFYVIGVATYGDPGSGVFPKAWDVLMKEEGEIEWKNTAKSYGIEFYTQEFCEERKWFYMACKEVKDLSYVPITMVGKSIPAHRYAVLSWRGGVAEIGNTLQSAYHEWLPSSGYVAAERFDFELYDERFKGPSHPETVIDLYVPIEKEE